MPLPGDQHKETAVTTNPFCPPQQVVSEYTAQEIATLQSRLNKQLGPEYISTRQGPGGGRVHYLAAEKVINLANEVFGFNGWSSAIQNVQVDFVDEDPRNGDITLGLSASVRVTLRDGTFHEDIGYGQMKNCKGKAAAFEKAKKEAVTDGLKRALRNFGNVLGNCLYDKDYLQKVTKVKVAPSKWDAENLHRHRDFAPIKKESIAEIEAKKEKEAASRRQTSAQSGISFGSMEFEDDFGSNLLDDADFVHPDEVGLDETPAKKAPPKQQSNGPQQQVQRTASMPQTRPSNAQTPTTAPIPQQQPQRPPVQQFGGGPVQAQRMPPPQPAHMQQRPSPAVAPNQQAAQANTNNSGPKTNQASATVNDASSSNPQNPNEQQVDEHGFPIPRMPPPGAPEGFVTGRVADLVNQNQGSRPANAAIQHFNPQADSPSIRRTQGVNPGRSAPVTRQALNGGSTTNPNPNAAAAPAGPSNGMNGNTTPVRANFVNPGADPNRRIGMPQQAGAQGMQNRGAYRPPSAAAVKRPALSDVSNLQQNDGAGDAKRTKTEAGESENTSGAAAAS